MLHSHHRIVDWVTAVYARDVPLEIVRPGILMVPVRTEWTNIAWRLMYETVSNHLILPFETPPTLGPRTALHGAIMRSC